MRKTFRFCTSLKKIELPEYVTDITEICLGSGLEEVTLPGSISAMKNAFQDCRYLNKVTFSNKIRKLQSAMFSNCDSLKTIELPLELDSIENSAFKSCGLRNLNIPSKTKYIGNYAFQDCEYLTKVSLNDSLEEIGNGAFEFTQLKEIIIPKNVKHINKYAFNGIKDIQKVICYATEVPIPNTSDGDLFSVYARWATLYVPNESIEAYKSSKYWNCFGNIKPIEEYETEINDLNYRDIHITSNGGVIHISGMANNTIVSTYSLSGNLIQTAKVENGDTYLKTDGHNVVILKIGNESMKMSVK